MHVIIDDRKPLQHFLTIVSVGNFSLFSNIGDALERKE